MITHTRQALVWGVVVAGVALLILTSTFNTSSTEESVRIGYVGSLTGFLEGWGVESRRSIEIALQEINDTGGIQGKPLEVLFEDGKCDAAAATNAAQKLLNIDKVEVLMSYCTLETLTVAPIAEERQALLFAPAATNPDITNAGDYTFRLAPSDAAPAQALAARLEGARIAILTEASDYSMSFREHVLDSFEGTVVFDETYIPETKDFRTVLAKLSLVDIDAFIVNAHTPQAEALIIKQAEELGVETPRYGLYWGSDPTFIELAGQAAEGFMYYDFVVDVDDERIQSFLYTYEERYGEQPPTPQFAVLSYDGVYVLKEAIEQVGTDPDALKEYLYTMPPYSALSGEVTFDENGDAQGTTFNLFRIENGVPVFIE